MFWILISVLVISALLWHVMFCRRSRVCIWIKEGEYWTSDCGLRMNVKYVVPVYCPHCQKEIHTSEVIND